MDGHADYWFVGTSELNIPEPHTKRKAPGVQRPLMSTVGAHAISHSDTEWILHRRIPTDRTLIGKWNELAASQSIPTPFMTYEWIATWWRHFGEGRKLFIVTGHRHGRLVAVAPMMISRVRLLPPLSGRILEFIGTAPVTNRGMGLADRIDFAVCGDAPGIREEMIRSILDHGAEFDLLRIRAINAESPSVPSLEEECRQRGLSISRIHRSWSLYSETTGSWDAYLGSRRGRTRRMWRNSCRRLERFGRSEFSSYPENGMSFSEALQTILSVNRNSYKWTDGSSLFLPFDLNAFYADLFEQVDANRWFVAHFLHIDGKPVAYQAGFDFADRLLSYNASFDRSYGAAHPGIHLVVHVIQKAFAEGKTEYDMMRGDDAYKVRWATGRREEIHLAVYSGTMRSRLTFLLHVKAREALKTTKGGRRLYEVVTRFRTRLRS